jgi:hypothetical protein
VRRPKATAGSRAPRRAIEVWHEGSQPWCWRCASSGWMRLDAGADGKRVEARRTQPGASLQRAARPHASERNRLVAPRTKPCFMSSMTRDRFQAPRLVSWLLPIVVALVFTLLVSLGGHRSQLEQPHTTRAVTVECSDATKRDACVRPSVTGAVIAATPFAGRAPAIPLVRAFSPKFLGRRQSVACDGLASGLPGPSIAWRRHIPRMDSGEPPRCEASAS